MVIPSLISRSAGLNLRAPVWSSLVLGVLGTLCFSSSVKAAEAVILEYGTQERTFPVRNIETFTQSGQAQDPELRSFFDENPELRRLVQELFSAEITIGSALLDRIEQGSQSPTIDFVLIQLNKLISTPSTPEDFQPLRTAIIDSLRDDGRLSIAEIIRNYPASEIRLNVTGLEPVFNDVKAFVERILPALEVARDYLKDVICDCETQSAQSTDNRRSSADGTTVLANAQSSNCRSSQVTVQSQPEQPDVQTQAALVEPAVVESAVAQPAQR